VSREPKGQIATLEEALALLKQAHLTLVAVAVLPIGGGVWQRHLDRLAAEAWASMRAVAARLQTLKEEGSEAK